MLPGVYFEPTAGGEVRIVGVYTNKQTNKTNKFFSEKLPRAIIIGGGA